MKIVLYSLLHNDIVGQYTLDYTGGSVSEGNALSILAEAKQRFKIAGKTFIMVTASETLFLTKVKKKWKSYKLGKGTEDVEQT